MPGNGRKLQPEEFFHFLRLRRATQNAFEPLGFSPYEAAILLHIDNGANDRNDHAKLLALQESAVSSLTTGLVNRQLLTRKKSSQDAHRSLLKLTARGRKEVTDLRAAWNEQMA